MLTRSRYPAIGYTAVGNDNGCTVAPTLPEDHGHALRTATAAALFDFNAVATITRRSTRRSCITQESCAGRLQTAAFSIVGTCRHHHRRPRAVVTHGLAGHLATQGVLPATGLPAPPQQRWPSSTQCTQQPGQYQWGAIHLGPLRGSPRF
jgi:hypothetical protein